MEIECWSGLRKEAPACALHGYRRMKLCLSGRSPWAKPDRHPAKSPASVRCTGRRIQRSPHQRPSIPPPLRGSRKDKGASPQSRRWGVGLSPSSVLIREIRGFSLSISVPSVVNLLHLSISATQNLRNSIQFLIRNSRAPARLPHFVPLCLRAYQKDLA